MKTTFYNSLGDEYKIEEEHEDNTPEKRARTMELMRKVELEFANDSDSFFTKYILDNIIEFKNGIKLSKIMTDLNDEPIEGVINFGYTERFIALKLKRICDSKRRYNNSIKKKETIYKLKSDL